MAHVYGHARPFWSMAPFKQAKDFWEWEKHPWNTPVPKDCKGIYPTKSQWEAQSDVTADKWRRFHDVESKSGERRAETDMQMMERIREANPEPSKAYGYPMASRTGEHDMYGQAQRDIAAGKYAPEEEDDMDKLLKYMFMSELMAGMAGDPAPTPYTVQVGPAAREFTPYNMFS